MKIRKKLLLGYVICSVMTALAVYLGVYSLAKIKREMQQTNDSISNNISESNKFSTSNQKLSSIIDRTYYSEKIQDLDRIKSDFDVINRDLPSKMAKLVQRIIAEKKELLLANASLNSLNEAKSDLLKKTSLASAELVNETESATAKTISESIELIKENARTNNKNLSDNLDKMSSSTQEVLENTKKALDIKIKCNELVIILNEAYLGTDSALVNAGRLQAETLVSNLESELADFDEEEINKAKSKIKSLKNIVGELIKSKQADLAKKTQTKSDVQPERKVKEKPAKPVKPVVKTTTLKKAVTKTSPKPTKKISKPTNTDKTPKPPPVVSKTKEYLEQFRKIINSIISNSMAAADNIEFNSTIAIEDSVGSLKEGAGKNGELLIGSINKMSKSTDQAITDIKTVLIIESTVNKLGALISEILLSSSPDQIKSSQLNPAPLFTKASANANAINNEGTKRNTINRLNKLKNLSSQIITQRLDYLKLITRMRKTESNLKKELSLRQKLLKDKADGLKQKTNKSMTESKKEIDAQGFWLYLIGFFAVIIALGIGIYISNKITKPINKITEAAEEIARGNLSVDLNIDNRDETGQLANSFNVMRTNLDSKASLAQEIAKGNLMMDAEAVSEDDELGKAFITMVEDLNLTLRGVNNTALDITSSADELNDSSTQLSEDTAKQARTLEEIETSILSLDKKTKANTENANGASQVSENARKEAEGGGQDIDDMLKAMDTIQSSNKEISRIIRTIEDIAFQTNILALNAAVEAARAGQYGKGFAVVAEEVRSLANRSAKASADSEALISASTKEINSGYEVAKKTSESFKKIIDEINKINDLSSQIADGSNEQSEMVSQIKNSLAQIDRIAQHNSSVAGETASASQELNQKANALNSLLQHFSLRDDYSKALPEARRESETRLLDA